MKKLFTFSGLLVMAFLLAWSIGFGVHKARAQQPPVKAFQIWTHGISTIDGTVQSVDDEYFARRTNGSTFAHAGQRKWWYFPGKGIRVQSADKTQDFTTRGYGRPKIQVDNKTCPGSDDGRVILGYPTMHQQINQTGADGTKIVTDVWAALDLDCHPLIVNTDYLDPVSGRLKINDHAEVTKVALGDPPNDVFALPSGSEVPPSQMEAYTISPDLISRNTSRLAKLDKLYDQEKAYRAGDRSAIAQQYIKEPLK